MHRKSKDHWVMLMLVLASTTGLHYAGPGLAADQNENSSIKIAWPPAPPSKIEAPASFIVGAIRAGDALTCNGEAVRVNDKGFFAHVIPLKPGSNRFDLVETGFTNTSRHLDVLRESEPEILSRDILTIAPDSIQPSQEMAVVPGDFIQFSLRATPGASVNVLLDKASVPLRTLDQPRQNLSKHHTRISGRATKSQTKVKGVIAGSAPGTTGETTANTKIDLDLGLSVAYGKAFQRFGHNRPDVYYGFYRVGPNETWSEVVPKVTARLNGKTVVCSFSRGIRLLRDPLIAETAHDDTIVRVGPNTSRTTPLAQGVRLLVDGWQGDQMRCLYAPGKHVWIGRADLIWENGESTRQERGVPGPAPAATAKTINIGNDDYGSYVAIPLTQRLPYQVVQTLKPNALVLKIFGVTGDTDWISDPRLDASGQDDNGQGRSRPIETVTWNQASDAQYEVHVGIAGHRQWGFKVDYSGNELRLHVKRRPAIHATAEHPLAGLKICLDPGHGGSERGAIGCSLVPEADINLAIALKLRPLLESAGAQVFMTRTTDQLVPLEDRPRFAYDKKVDILLSIHNNSLPDGRDPWKEKGSSSYYYHPQSTDFARTMKNGLLGAVHLQDIGCRFQNLALCRPSGMLASLCEVGFMINPDEYALLINDQWQQTAAQGLADGLKNYFRTGSSGNPGAWQENSDKSSHAYAKSKS